jgi:beta-glucosidase
MFNVDEPRENARQLAASLTLEEQVCGTIRFSKHMLTWYKVSLLAGQDFWRTMPIPSKGIPSIKTSDGPNGARGALFKDGTPVSIMCPSSLIQ